MEKSIGEKILAQQFALNTNLPLPDGIEYLYPYADPETKSAMTAFYQKYFSDRNPRTVLLGINPGRFGAGVTGVPFTDPVRLEGICGIENPFQKRQELSSAFVFDVIRACGGLENFYASNYITSVCPLGFTKDGKNYNYYDDRDLQEAVLPLIKNNLETLIGMGIRSDIAFSMGKGKNYKFLVKLNSEFRYFDKVVALPHPRWVMQYRLKMKDQFVHEYRVALEATSKIV